MRFEPLIVRTDISGRPDSSETYAIHFPSGENRASYSLDAPASSDVAALPSSATVHTSAPCAVRTFSSSRPSTLQSVGSQYAAGHGKDCSIFVPSAAAIFNVRWPCRPGRLPDTYARRFPSGDHVAWMSGAAALVTRTW